MATYEGSGFNDYNIAPSANYVVNVPAGTLPNDILWIHITTKLSTPHTINSRPSNCTTIFDNVTSGGSFSATVIAWKAPSSSIPTTLTFVLSTSQGGSTAWARFRGVDPAQMLSGSAVSATGLTLLPTSPELITADDDAFIISGLSLASGSATVSPPSGWTAAVVATGRIGAIAYKGTKPTAGNAGTARWTISSSIGSHVYQVAFKSLPIVAPPAGVTPVANFTNTSPTGAAPQTIAFTDTSTNTPTSWLWNFGDGDTSTSQNPSHAFATNAIFTVSLTATNATGSNTTSKTVTISAPPASLPASGPVPAQAQTLPFTEGTLPDADDPAIWYNAANPGQSVVIGTNKADPGGGLGVYDLNAMRIQYLPIGKMNNVDLRDGVFSGRVLVVSSNRTTNAIAFFWLDRTTRMLSAAGETTVGFEPYGCALYVSAVTGKVYAFITQNTPTSGAFRQYELTVSGSTVSGTLVRSLTTTSLSEGLVADDATGVIFLSHEDVGLYAYGAEPGAGSSRTTVDTVGGGHLVADVEGCAIAYGRNGLSKYLLVSSQGDSTFHVYDADAPFTYRKSFTVAANGGVDGANECDGIDVTRQYLNATYPNGLIVVQDGVNTTGTGTNFKYVDAGDVLGTYTLSGSTRNPSVVTETPGASVANVSNPVDRWIKPVASAAWWTGTRWDAVLPVTDGYAIFKDIYGTCTRSTQVETRLDARPDITWAAGQLAVLRGHATTSRLTTFDSNYTPVVTNVTVPLTVTDNDSTPMVLHRSPDGALWVAVVSANAVKVARSTNGGTTWSTATTLATFTQPTGVVVMQTSGSKLVLVASENGAGGSIRLCRTIDYGASSIAVGSWATETLPTMAPAADDHLAAVTYADTIYIAGKSDAPLSSDPLIYLLKRTSAGAWSQTTVVSGPDTGDRPTRPSVATDGTKVWVCYGLIAGTKGAFYKSAAVGALSTWTTAAPIFTGGDYNGGVNLPEVPVTAESGLPFLAHERGADTIMNVLLHLSAAPPSSATPSLIYSIVGAPETGAFKVSCKTTNASSLRIKASEIVAGGPVVVPPVDPPPVVIPPVNTTGYPDATNTGVPAGVTLTNSGSINVTTNGAIVQNLRITGSITVNADNVIIRNCLQLNTSSSVSLRNYGSNLIIQDCEFDGQGKGNPSHAYNNYTILRCNIHGYAEGPRIAGGNVLIKDSFIHHMVQVGTNHTDAIQQVGGSSTSLIHNNIQIYNPDTKMFGNASFQFGDDQGSTRGTIVSDNYMNGGNYTINGGGAGTTTATGIFRNNKFGHDHRYGIKANLGPGVDYDSSNGYLAGTVVPGQSGIGSNVNTVTATQPTTTTTTAVTAAVTTGATFFSPSFAADGSGWGIGRVAGLVESTAYEYAIEMTNASGVVTTTAILGKAKTLPVGQSNFSFAFGSCLQSGATVTTPFDRIVAKNPDLFFHLGDFHYADNSTTSQASHLTDMEGQLVANAGLRALLAKIPTLAIKSDHDAGGGNNAPPGVYTAPNRAAYKQMFPTPTLSDANALYWAFVVGRVKMIFTDHRYLRTDTSMMGDTQKTWFKAQMLTSEPVKIWVQDATWLTAEPAVLGGDKWSDHVAEHAELGDFLAVEAVGTVITVHGDQHAVSADSGASNAFGGFPSFCAAPFQNTSSLKGGPWSVPPYPTTAGILARQYGIVTITDIGTSISVAFKGYDLNDVVRAALTITTGTAPAPDPTSSISVIRSGVEATSLLNAKIAGTERSTSLTIVSSGQEFYI